MDDASGTDSPSPDGDGEGAGGGAGEDALEFHKFFPSFIWVLRDFALDLVDEEGYAGGGNGRTLLEDSESDGESEDSEEDDDSDDAEEDWCGHGFLCAAPQSAVLTRLRLWQGWAESD